MNKINWDHAKYSVGHPLLDAQHQRLIEIINELVELSNTDFKKTDAIKTLTQLNYYAKQHFGAEETLLQAFRFPFLAEQKASHEQFSGKIVHILNHCTGNEINEVISFLTEWWTHHILIEDMQYKHIFAEAA